MENIRTPNHADDVYQQRQFWAKLANDYANVDNPDISYLTKVLSTAAMWEDRWQDYISHIKATYNSLHVPISA